MKHHAMNKTMVAALAAMVAVCAVASEDRIEALERQMAAASAEIASLKGERQDLSVLEGEGSKLALGGYGEIHANFEEGGKDKFDIHRLVMYVGYEFADWIRLSSETELEHAYVNDGDGEISIEQLYVDFLFADAFNVRAGRVLAPLGIINQYHEPTLFFGVERPNVDKNIIPSTWSLDGAGIFGSPLSWLTYEGYVVAGLDGSMFRAKDGIRKGRIKERGSFNDIAVAGRVDLFPFVDCDLPADQDLRVGFSSYCGGTDNVDEGGGNGIDNTFSMYSADFEYDVSRFRFRGVVVHGENSDAGDLQSAFGNEPGEEIFGWYLEGGVGVMPEPWKTGRLAEADIIPFVRYEEYDTHHKVPSNVVKDDSLDIREITIGVNMPLARNFVLKADAQFVSNGKSGSSTVTKYNLGMGWVFQ